MCGGAYELTCAYGALHQEFLGTMRNDGTELRSPAGVKHIKEYAVKMVWVKALFDDGFWDKRFAQFGLGVLTPEGLQRWNFVFMWPRDEQRLMQVFAYDEPMDEDEIAAGVVPWPLTDL